MGKVSLIYGPESCLDADTFIQYKITTGEGKVQTSEGGTIETLYHLFNEPLLGAHFPALLGNLKFTAPCMGDDGVIFQNQIVGVSLAGEKPCLEITTSSGNRIIATKEHKFHVGSGYVPLGDLKVGNTILIRDRNLSLPLDASVALGYQKVVYVKHHPYGVPYETGCYTCKGLLVSRVVAEAHLNGFSYEEYRSILNSGPLDGLTFLTPDQYVHHKDEDYSNNNLENLLVAYYPGGVRPYEDLGTSSARSTVIEDKIISISDAGVHRTYDISMKCPYNNFVANDFVVHNSNKTNTVLCAIAQGQLKYPDKVAVFVDVEHALDLHWAQQLGVDIDRLIVVHPEYAEQAADLTESFLYAEDVFCVALDSIAALTTQNEVESSTEKVSVGGASLLVGKLFRKAVVSFNKMQNQNLVPPAFLAINQIRNKIGVLYGSPEVMPGGNAPKYASSMTVRVYGKNILDKKINPVVPSLKEVSTIVQKWKVPILSINATYSMLMLGSGGNKVGSCHDWNTVATYLKELDYLSKAEKGGWVLFGNTFKTLDECKNSLYSNPMELAEVKSTIIEELLAQGGMTSNVIDVADDEDVKL